MKQYQQTYVRLSAVLGTLMVCVFGVSAQGEGAFEGVPYDQLVAATCEAKTDLMREWGFERLEITMQDLAVWSDVQGIYGKRYIDDLMDRIRNREDETKLMLIFESGARDWLLTRLTAAKASRDSNFDPSVIEEDLDVYRQDLLMVMAVNWIYEYSGRAQDLKDERVLSYYEENREHLYREPEQAQIRLIVLGVSEDADQASSEKARELGEKLRERIRSGEDMAALAEQYSTTIKPGSGGFIDFFSPGTFNPELEKAIFALSLGEISPVLTLEKGVYLIRREGNKPAAYRPLDEDLRESIREKLLEDDNKEFLEEMLVDIRSTCEVETHPETLLDKESKGQEAAFAVRVDQYALTAAEVLERAHALGRQKTLEHAESIVSDRVKALLLVRKAETLGLDTVKEYRDTMAVAREAALKKYYEKYLREKASSQALSEEDCRSYYKENLQVFVEPPQRRISMIFLPHAFPLNTPGKSAYEVGKARSESRKLASDLREKLLQGADFAEMARKYSKDPSASEGGDLGFVDDVQGNDNARLVAGAKDGEISDLICTNDGYAILQPNGRRPPRQIPYEECRERVHKDMKRLLEEKAVADVRDELLSQMEIRLNPEVFVLKDPE